jgi:hypothetical protein
VEASRWRASAEARADVVRLLGPHWLKLRVSYSNGKRGVVAMLKRGHLPPPF